MGKGVWTPAFAGVTLIEYLMGGIASAVPPFHCDGLTGRALEARNVGGVHSKPHIAPTGILLVMNANDEAVYAAVRLCRQAAASFIAIGFEVFDAAFISSWTSVLDAAS